MVFLISCNASLFEASLERPLALEQSCICGVRIVWGRVIKGWTWWGWRWCGGGYMGGWGVGIRGKVVDFAPTLTLISFLAMHYSARVTMAKLSQAGIVLLKRSKLNLDIFKCVRACRLQRNFPKVAKTLEKIKEKLENVWAPDIRSYHKWCRSEILLFTLFNVWAGMFSQVW